MLYAADHTFWRAYHPEFMTTFQGELWSCSEKARDEYGLYWIPHGGAEETGLNPTPGLINMGGNSGFQAVSLAAVFQGAQLPGFEGARMVLLGFDMQRTRGKSHCHGNHIGGLPNGSNFLLWMDRFRPLARDLKSRGVEVLNCTRETAMRCFPRATLAEALR